MLFRTFGCFGFGHISAAPGLARLSQAWAGLAWPGLARAGQAWPGLAQPGIAKLGQAWPLNPIVELCENAFVYVLFEK